jgi:arginine/lysine/ornithine decarboxylase
MKEVPILDQLLKLQEENIVSFHVPGHKNGRIFNKFNYKNFTKYMLNMDTTEIDGTDYLHNPSGIIKEAQDQAKKLFKSDETFFLVNGSTSGIYSMIMACTSPGDEIIVSRDCHHSVMNSLFLADLKPIFIYPKIDLFQGIALGVSPDEIENALQSNPHVKAVVVTYPTYYGIASDLKKIADIVHKYDKILLVDEAHGAHLGLSDRLPKTALACGADAVVQSTHKTLPSFTQSAMLHLQGKRIDLERVKFMLRMHQSSSPSYLLLASLDLARNIYENHGRCLMEELLENIEDFRNKMQNLEGSFILGKEVEGKHFVKEVDLTRIWISLCNWGVSGYELNTKLRSHFNIQMELSNLHGALGIATIGSIKKDFEELYCALEIMGKEKKKKNDYRVESFGDLKPRGVYTLRQAFYKEKKKILLEESRGQISGEYIIPYPPGIPILTPGEVIDGNIINYLQAISRQQATILGLTNREGLWINVIKE